MRTQQANDNWYLTFGAMLKVKSSEAALRAGLAAREKALRRCGADVPTLAAHLRASQRALLHRLAELRRLARA